MSLPEWLNYQNINNSTFNGFLPVIINITPVTNLHLLLGELEEQSDDKSIYLVPYRKVQICSIGATQKNTALEWSNSSSGRRLAGPE